MVDYYCEYNDSETKLLTLIFIFSLNLNSFIAQEFEIRRKIIMEANNNRIPSIRDVDLKGKIVLMRADHNVVKKGVIHDPYRIDCTIETLSYIYSQDAKAILMTHVGRPKDKATGKINIGPDTSVVPIAEYLKNKLHMDFITPDVIPSEGGIAGISSDITSLADDLRYDKIDGIYLPNTRWFAGEESKGDMADSLAKQLAGLADVYVNDAFGSWQPHVSTVGVTKYLPAYAGFLMEKEIENLGRIFNPEPPFVAVVAGSKFDTKIKSLSALLQKADHLILGGVLYNAYLAAKYGFKINGLSAEDIASASEFVEFAKDFPGRIVELPLIVESDTMEGKLNGQHRTVDIRTFEKGAKLNFVLDAAAESFDEPDVKEVFANARTIFVNAVMGFAPHFNDGTIALDQIIDNNKDAMKLFGGGDTLQEMKRLLPEIYLPTFDNPKYYLFTGGGAVLKAIQEGSFAGIEPVRAIFE